MLTMKTLKTLVLIAIVLSISSSIKSQTTKEDAMSGKWLGELVVNESMKLKMAFDIKKDDSNVYHSLMHSVDQKTYNILVNNTSIKGDSIIMHIKSLGATYQAKLVNDTTLIGSFKQGKGKSLALNITKTGKFPFKVISRIQEPKEPYSYYSENVTFDNQEANVKLSGTFTRPFNVERYPTVVLISGSGPSDRNQTIFGHKTFLVLADYLTRNGIAVLRYDDRGAAESTGNFKHATIYNHATDVSAALDYLSTRTDVDLKHLGVIGHSLGANIATLATNMNSKSQFVILLAGSAIPLKDDIIEQCNAIYTTLGVSNENIDLNRQILESTMNIIKYSSNDSIAKVEIKKSFEKYNPLVEAMNITDREKLELSSPLKIGDYASLLMPFMKYDLFFDPAEELSKIKCPMLAIMGDKDIQVLPHNLEKIERIVKNGGNKMITTELFNGKNHLLQSCIKCTIEEYRELEETMSPEVQEKISKWINSRKLQ